MRRLALATLIAAAGCRPTIPVDRFDCTLDTDCPPGQRCVSGLCGTGTPLDGGRDAAVDAPPSDALADALAPDTSIDASLDGGTEFRVRVLDAIPDVGGIAVSTISVSIGGVVQGAMLGCPITYEHVPRGATSITVDVAGDESVLSAFIDRDSLVVVARNASGAVASYVVADVPPPAATPGNVAVQYLDLLRTTATTQPWITTDIHDIAGSAAEIDFGMPSVPRELASGTRLSVGFGYVDIFIPRILVTFTGGDVTESMLVVVTGNADLHPGAAGGPRALVVPPVDGACVPPILPDAQIVGANLPQDRGFGRTIYACQRDTGFDAIAIGPGSVSSTTSTFGDLSTIGLASTATDACGPSARIVDLSTTERGRRYLLVVTGVVEGIEPNSWELTIVPELEAEMLTAVDEVPSASLSISHLANEVAPFDVDVTPTGITGPGARPASALGVGESFVSLVDAPILAETYEVRSTSTPGTILGVFTSPAPPTDPGGMFLVLVDEDRGFPVIPRPTMAFVRAPYGRTWSVTTVEVPGPS